jgi:hypothetical protein
MEQDEETGDGSEHPPPHTTTPTKIRDIQQFTEKTYVVRTGRYVGWYRWLPGHRPPKTLCHTSKNDTIE